MNTRQIEYIEQDEDVLELEADWAINQTMDDRFLVYCQHIIANYAVAGIDVINYPVKRQIYFIDDSDKY